jgi:hypothetical protein
MVPRVSSQHSQVSRTHQQCKTFFFIAFFYCTFCLPEVSGLKLKLNALRLFGFFLANTKLNLNDEEHRE